jgi:antitoxin (DNA-binding transcriptional repressor) of toxin-antitoxin stability system
VPARRGRARAIKAGDASFAWRDVAISPGYRPGLPYVVAVIRRIPSACLETITVTDVRTVLPMVLARLKDGGRDAVPVLIGRHREPMAVLVSLEQFHEYCSLVRIGLTEAPEPSDSAEPPEPADPGIVP